MPTGCHLSQSKSLPVDTYSTSAAACSRCQ